MKYLLIMVVVLIFLISYENDSDTKENKLLFQEGKPLKCLSGGGLYSESNKYRVSKKDGWSLEGNYFIKESLMLDAKKCEEI